MTKIWDRASALARRPGAVFAAAFLLLLAWNLPFLSAPPYWDAILGPFAEGLWLKNHQFDYNGLWFAEADYFHGGAAIYKYSVVPTIYALLYLAFSTKAVLILLHLLSIFCAAAIFTMTFFLIKPHTGAPAALLWCLAAAADPLFSGQAAAVNMEMPMIAASTAALLALHRSRYRRYCAWALAALLVKQSSLILAVASAALLIAEPTAAKYLRFKPAPPRGPKEAALVILPLGFILSLQMIFKTSLTAYPYFFADATALPRLVHLPKNALFFTPSLFVELLILLAFGAVFILRRGILFFHRGRIAAKAAPTKVHEDGGRGRLVLFLTIIVLGFWTSSVLFTFPLARYFTFLVFFSAVLLALILPARLSVAAAALFLVFNAANQYGALMGRAETRSGHILERSREYLIDLASNREICRRLEVEHFDEPIVTKYPFAQMLTLPELGYVAKPLPRVYALGTAPTYAPVKSLAPGEKLPPDSIFVFASNIFELSFPPSLAPAPGAVTIAADRRLPSPVVVWKYP